MQLQGYNNLTKTLGVNSYNIAYTPQAEQRAAWQGYIAERYSCERLTQLLSTVATQIGASILNIARQAYEPQGASVTMLIAEQSIDEPTARPETAQPEHVVMHLDKSHLTVHTYPESDPESGISSVRVDIDISTCGLTSPLKIVNYLLSSLESDIVTLDYRVRGFTRAVGGGRKHFIDHKINSIQDFMAQDILRAYRAEDSNLCREAIFHTRMMCRDFYVEDYLFNQSASAYSMVAMQRIKQAMFEEMTEIFRGSSVSDDERA